MNNFWIDVLENEEFRANIINPYPYYKIIQEKQIFYQFIIYLKN